MSTIQIGFDVPEWKSKPFQEFSNEELLEYWFKLRISKIPFKHHVVELKDASTTELYISDLQVEIIKRMGGK